MTQSDVHQEGRQDRPVDGNGPTTGHDAASPYRLYVYHGEGSLPEFQDASTVAIRPDDASFPGVLEAISRAGLTAADLRTRTLFVAGHAPVESTLLVYTALCGFAARSLDFSDIRHVFDVRALQLSLTELLDPLSDPGPSTRSSSPEFLFVDLDAGPDVLSPAVLADARSVRKVFFRAGTSPVLAALETLVTLAAVRARGSVERFPILVPSRVDAFDPGNPDVASCLDLDDLRRQGAQLRRSRRIDDRSCTVEPVEMTARQRRLIAAAAVPVDDVLVRLGSVRDEVSGFWRCPRPERHRNGDANPSAKAGPEGFRCFRCDAEQIDVLRLVMDAKTLAPDDAADWLLGV